MAMSRPKEVARWVVLLPLALVATALVMFPVHWAVLLLHGLRQEGELGLGAIPERRLEAFGYALFCPFTFISVGVWAAPRYKFVTALALAGTVAVGLGLLFGVILMALSDHELAFESNWEWIQAGVVTALTVCGVVWAVREAYTAEAVHGPHVPMLSPSPDDDGRRPREQGYAVSEAELGAYLDRLRTQGMAAKSCSFGGMTMPEADMTTRMPERWGTARVRTSGETAAHEPASRLAIDPPSQPGDKR